jgi:hypothetical protein
VWSDRKRDIDKNLDCDIMAPILNNHHKSHRNRRRDRASSFHKKGIEWWLLLQSEAMMDKSDVCTLDIGVPE